MANDIPTFSVLQEIIAALLDVQVGILTISVGSFHVYESRFEMFKDIIREFKHEPVLDVPRISKAEAYCLSSKYINPDYAFSRWLLDV
jgi:thymidylate synthase